MMIMRAVVAVAFWWLAVLGSFAQQWALPHVSVAHVRVAPSHRAEMSTQVLMGMPLRVDNSVAGGWVAVTLADGYKGYVRDNALTFLNESSFDRWRNSHRAMVVSVRETYAFVDSTTVSAATMSDLVGGDIVRVLKAGRDVTKIELPDGRVGWVRSEDICDLAALPDYNCEGVIAIAMAQMGVPYLWGGCTSKGMDCSGLTKLAYYCLGLILPRDASQQYLVGERIVSRRDVERGDLVFYGDPSTGSVNHVAIYIGDDSVVEAAGRVKVTPVDAAGHIVGIKRIGLSKDDVARVATHAWYSLQE